MHGGRVVLSYFHGTFEVVAIFIFCLFLVLFTIETADLEVNFVVSGNRVRQLLTEGALGTDCEIGLVVILMAVQNVLEVNCFIGYVEGHCYYRNQVVQL